MPGNLKQLVRDRMAKTGESYQTAQRHVRSQQPSSSSRFEALVLSIVSLAKARNAEYDADPRHHGGRNLAEALEEMLDPLPPREAALIEALSRLPYRELRKVEVLMYSGRDGDGVHTVERTLDRDRHDVTVGVVSGELPLDRYLEAGLARAKRDGVDLDGDF